MNSYFLPEDREEQEALPQEVQDRAVEAIPAEQHPSIWSQIVTMLREVLETILLTLVIFFLIRFAVENYRVEGQSMEPNFHNGQYLLVNKLSYKIGKVERNDVIIFHFPLDETKNYIKRVIGLPGETVQIKDGQVYINNVLVQEIYPINHATYSYGPTTVSPDEYFVLGDNRPESSDSHFWGLVPARDIVGKAWLCYWPPDMWGLLPDYSLPQSTTTIMLTLLPVQP